MKIKHYKKDKSFSIVLNKDVEICIKYEDNVGDFYDKEKVTRIYFVDYFDDSKIITNEEYQKGVRTYPYCENSGYNYQLSEVFDELYLAIEYIENNFNVPKSITKQIKL